MTSTRSFPLSLAILAAAGILAPCSAGPDAPDSPAAESAGSPVQALHIEQVVSGLPGRRAGETSRSVLQQLVVDLRGERLVLKQYPIAGNAREEGKLPARP